MSDHAQLPSELQREVNTLVEQARQRGGWPVRQTLRALEIAPATYYRWCRATAQDKPRARSPAGSMYELLDSEREAIMDYALKHPEVRHRELAWKMLDEGVVAVSASSVYRVLREANLVCGWRLTSVADGLMSGWVMALTVGDTNRELIRVPHL